MARTHSSLGSESNAHGIGQLRADRPLLVEPLTCSRCSTGLECVEQNRRAGAWVGSYLCPRCRSEYLYGYRWGHLLRKN